MCSYKRINLFKADMQNGHLRPEISIESEKVPLEDDRTPVDLINLDTIPDRILEAELSEEEERIVLNVGGVRHETHISTLRNIPETRLAKLAEQHLLSPETKKEVYFFDRHPAVFKDIIDFYRTGELHTPLEVCGAVVKRELDYWQINENHIKSCCWRTYRSHIENKRILDSFNRSILKEHIKIDVDSLEGWKRFQMKVWLILEHPRTSKLAMVYGVISLLFVVTSISGFCLETLPQLKPQIKHISPNETFSNVTGGCDGSSVPQYLTPNEYLQVIDTICTVYFTIELIVRFTFSPNKIKFVRSAMNIIDLLALVPLYMQLILNMDSFKFCFVNERLMIEIMFILRIIRMFRIFHLVKHYQALQILVYALKASCQELLMLGIFLLIGMLVFATMIYYAERQDAMTPGQSIPTIPLGFWWALITMTTVGYGDVHPETPIGYIVGTFCSVSGVLLLALTYPVISNNFTLFYTHVRSRTGRSNANTVTTSDSSEILFESSEDDGTKLLYENARRTSNGSIILTNRSFILPRTASGMPDIYGNASANGNLRVDARKDANSMMNILVKRDESFLFTRTNSIKAHSDDGVTYTGEDML